MILSSVVVFVALAFATATEVQQCVDGPEHVIESVVEIRPCKKLPCKLKKGTEQFITIEFTPDTDFDEIKNRVSANVFGVKVPFIGVDGNSICSKIFTASDEKADCPLKAGTKYVYKDSFPILGIYPTIPVQVHWALEASEKKFICFEVPARIVQ
ncbi:PREDICTED: ecdysteroid-regulated 16 kDa protein-like [Papilio xuthus]|uniref:Ecdysteroid-regulated 16 kDa protein n=1 Tax=Papilio xuthus TaxID=66420 RepID=I4DJC1_PAPXU|nr:ecdysteroid-regulated 16 kDa protein-like precursor [Papilio xuthus]KPI92279.1 Ecdysteroid-regulated 16 kDa protein [Papilio xuthus]BAM18011.1 niemann-pick type C-2b [Papilio xuthus]